MILLLILSVGVSYFFALPFCSLLQGSGYKSAVFLKRSKKYIALSIGYFVLLSPASIACGFLLRGAILYATFFFLFLLTALFVFFVSKKMNVKLTVTNRLVRLLIGETAVAFLSELPFAFFGGFPIWSVSPSLAPLFSLVANAALTPFEKINNARYVKRAKEKLSEMDAIKIGITGSYGKTSVKTALDRFLSPFFETLTAPENYNTPLGIARMVETAKGNEEIVIAEMGARRRGDIKELCEIVRPTMGIITGIAPQHLETFLSLENIVKEKNELANAISNEGIVVYNVSDPMVRKMSNERVGKKITVGFENADCLIKNVCVSERGTEFDFLFGEKTLRLNTPLVGLSSAVNLSLAAAAALYLGVKEEAIIAAAEGMIPAPHRAELLKSGGLLIIDDSYNVNPVGAFSALSTLQLIKGNHKIVYTSGMVELGKEEEKLNVAFGKRIAEVCDVAIVANGPYGDFVKNGILSGGFPPENLYRVENTEEATSLFPRVTAAGDVVLITSDLPRDYLL